MANHIITLNQIIELFEQFADNHPQLQSFGFGPTSDIGTSVKMQYPAMWSTFETDSSMMVQNRNISPELNFTMLFMDKINIQPNVKDANGFDSDNQREILSDTLQMAQDLLSEMVSYWGQYGIGVTDNVSTFPLVDETDDKVNGWGLRFSLRLKHFNCATEIGDIRIEKPTEINYLTCDTLPDCQVIKDIQTDIAAISGSTGGLTCATLPNCQVIQDIQTDINTNTNDIVLIKDDILELKALTGGTTTFDCDDLDGCQTIIDIKSDISAISGSTGGGGEFTGNTSANCIGEFHVENIYGCARLTIHSPIQHNGCTASGTLSTAFGRNTIASGDYSFAQGRNSNATGMYSQVQGFNLNAGGFASHAQGTGTIASGNYSHAQGSQTTASGDASHTGGKGVNGGRVVAGGEASFAHFNNSGGGNKGAMANYSTILGGSNHNIEANANNSTILGGSNHNINSTATNSVILGGSGITATTSNTVYVPKLNINNIGTTTSINNLGIDADGNVVIGSAGGGSFDCDELDNCQTIIDIKNDLNNFYIGVNFGEVEPFNYVAPEAFKINTIDNPLSINIVINVNGNPYTLGDTISIFDELEITPDAIGFIKLNNTKL